jgi:hypothetical protein
LFLLKHGFEYARNWTDLRGGVGAPSESVEVEHFQKLGHDASADVLTAI